MANGFSINALATQYADRHLANQQPAVDARNLVRKRTEYDFKVTGFNVATVATITSLFLAVVTGSVAIFVLWVLAYNLRKSFMNAILTTALPNQNLLEVANRNLVQRRDQIAEHLEIGDANWKLVYQLADFNAWMYWTLEMPAPAVEGAAPAEVERAQADEGRERNLDADVPPAEPAAIPERRNNHQDDAA